jgi:uncharacterized protein (DUF1800 family)
MLSEYLWSLRLGFSTSEAQKIKDLGLSKFIDASFEHLLDLELPEDFDLNFVSKKGLERRSNNKEQQKEVAKKFLRNSVAMKKMILDRAYFSPYPLKENIALFWHNHFVATIKSVKNMQWIYEHYTLIHKLGLGNYKDLVKALVSSNAMIKYLNNDQNRKDQINENLARELLELFTLGEGNYTEKDIKNIARALAGLSIGKEGGVYRPRFTDTGTKEIFEKKGNFDLDEVIELIFKQKSTPFFISRKVLKWFVYDNPPEHLVKKYGQFLKENNFELAPFFRYIFIEEAAKDSAGSMMKNPLKLAFQVLKDLQIEQPNFIALQFFLKNQGMDIYQQNNVKGWQGGKDWLSSQIYLDRQGFVDYVLFGLKGKRAKRIQETEDTKMNIKESVLGTYPFKSDTNAQEIIQKMLNHSVSVADSEFKDKLNEILVYDFSPIEASAQQNVNRLYQFLAQSPEFQII